MADEYKKTALDDYFSSMLSMPKPVEADENINDDAEVQAASSVLDLELNQSALVESKSIATENFAIESIEIEPVEAENSEPELSLAELHLTSKDYDDSQVTYAMPDEPLSNNLQDLDQLLDSVVDIELADIDLSELETNLEFSQDAQLETDLAFAQLNDAVFEQSAPEEQALVEDGIDAVDSHSTSVELEPAEPLPETEVDVEPEIEELNIAPETEWKNVELDDEFQALFFEVAGVTFAVPLTELGGIYQTDNINALFGKPDWFLGIMQHRDQKYSVVDTVNWVMPEQNMGKIDYKYQIQLSESNWVLGSETLLGNETLKHSDIKWRTTPGTRPWLAGMVKSRMCVLLHVTEMIKLLESGINIHGQ